MTFYAMTVHLMREFIDWGISAYIFTPVQVSASFFSSLNISIFYEVGGPNCSMMEKSPACGFMSIMFAVLPSSALELEEITGMVSLYVLQKNESLWMDSGNGPKILHMARIYQFW